MRCWRGYLLERSANSLHMVLEYRLLDCVNSWLSLIYWERSIRGIQENFGGGPLNYGVLKGSQTVRRRYQSICCADVAM